MTNMSYNICITTLEFEKKFGKEKNRSKQVLKHGDFAKFQMFDVHPE